MHFKASNFTEKEHYCRCLCVVYVKLARKVIPWNTCERLLPTKKVARLVVRAAWTGACCWCLCCCCTLVASFLFLSFTWEIVTTSSSISELILIVFRKFFGISLQTYRLNHHQGSKLIWKYDIDIIIGIKFPMFLNFAF